MSNTSSSIPRFWGLELKPGHRYRQKFPWDLHLTQAALGLKSKKSSRTTIECEINGCPFTIGSLYLKTTEQIYLDLLIDSDVEICFQVHGENPVHLLGYFVHYAQDDQERRAIEVSVDGKEEVNGENQKEKQDIVSIEVDNSKKEKDEHKKKEDQKEKSQKLKKKKKEIHLVDEMSEDEEDEDEDYDEDEEDDANEMEESKKEVKQQTRNKKKSVVESYFDDEAEEGSDEDEDDEEDSEEEESNDDDAEEEEEEEEEEVQEKEEQKEDDEEKEEEEEDDDHDDQKEENEKEEDKSQKGNEKEDIELEVSFKKEKNKDQKEKQKGKQENIQTKNSGKRKMEEMEETSSKKKKNLSLSKKETKQENKQDAVQKEISSKKQEKTPSNKSEKGRASVLNKWIEIPATGGLKIMDTKAGTGKTALDNSKVVIKYLLRNLKTNKLIDLSRKPFTFTIGKRTCIQGFELGVKGMKIGGRRKIVIPPVLGYGSEHFPDIPKNTTLEAEIELLQIKTPNKKEKRQ